MCQSVSEPWFKKWRSDAVSFMRTGTRGSPSWPGLCPETGYVDADCSDQIAQAPCRRGGPYVFERRSGFLVLRMMPGPGRQLAQAQGTQFLAHRLLGEREPELLPDPLDQIDDAPTYDAMDRRVRPSLDNLEQGRPLPLVQQRRLARCLAGLKARRTVGVEAQDPIAHRLQPDAADRGSSRTRLAGIDRGQRQQASNLARINRRTGETAKLGRVKIRAERNRSCHSEPHQSDRLGESYSSRFGNRPRESYSARLGITLLRSL